MQTQTPQANPLTPNPAPSTPIHKNRVRFGIALPWPIANVAILVFYLDDAGWAKVSGAADIIRAVVDPVLSGFQSHFVCELS